MNRDRAAHVRGPETGRADLAAKWHGERGQHFEK
jgi:hypothetical protein